MITKKNFFLDPITIKTIDTIRVTYFVVFILSFALTEIGRKLYRPFIYKNNIEDFGIADSVGNWGGILAQIFFGLAIINSTKKKGLRLITLYIIGYMFYEIVQPYLPRGVFDWQDIYGTIIGGIFGLLLFILIHKITKQNKVFHRF